MTNDKNLHKGKLIERYIQQIAGIVIWILLMYIDHNNSLQLKELSSGEMLLHGLKYGFAAILIKGVSVAELSELIRAWKSK